MSGRYSNTDDTGVAILNLCLTKDLGWICRNTTHSDVGIDATVEQVIDDNPTAKYISVQLKTGLGNVHVDKNGDFIFYIDNIHYQYWLSSSIPVILILCDPETNNLYWQLIKKQNISNTKSQYKLLIKKEHLLNKSSVEELNTIIDTFQSEFELPELDNEDLYDTEYWEELLDNCAEAIGNSVRIFNQLDKKYLSHNDSMTVFLERNQTGIEKLVANKQISKHAKALKLAIDICKTQFRNQIPIIAKTHIEAIRLAEQAFCDKTTISIIIAARNCIEQVLCDELKTIESSIDVFKIGAEKYSTSSSPTFELRQSEYSFALVLKEYITELECIVFGIKKLIKTISSSE